MNHKQVAGLAAIVIVTVSLGTSANVSAQTANPSSGNQARLLSGIAVDEPAAPPLYDQTTHPGSNWSDSSDYGKSHNQQFGYLADQAADDFVVPSTFMWQIITTTVNGGYVGGFGAGVDHLVVQIYSNSAGNTPSTLLYSKTFASASIIGFATGQYTVVFNPPLTLGPGHYWLSAEALEECLASNCKHWVWTESTVTANAESVWRQPTPSIGYNCPNWAPRVSHCKEPSSSSGSDLLFKLEGTKTPILARLYIPVLHR